MIKLILKIILFLSGVSIFVMTLSLIPIDTFTFRNWESMIWEVEKYSTYGEFYPKIKSVRDENGDLGHNSKYDVIKKNIIWETDRYGFRNDQNISSKGYNIVLVGDSNAVGTGTTQKDILSNQISREIGSNVFNYSPMDIDKYFMNNLSDMGIHPKVVIFEEIERDIPDISKFNDENINLNHKYTTKIKIKNKIKALFSNNMLLYIEIARDRFYKKEPFNFVKGKIDSAFGKFNMPVSVGAEKNLFFDDSFFKKEISCYEVKLIADKLEKLSNSFAKQGIKFILYQFPIRSPSILSFFPKTSCR